MFATFKQPTVVTYDSSFDAALESCGDYKQTTLNILRKSKTPPKFLKGKPLTALDFTRHDSTGCADDIDAWKKLGVVFNGIPENLEPTVFNAYKELKNNPSKVDDYDNQRSGSSSRSM